jgi:hypothetical protein
MMHQTRRHQQPAATCVRDSIWMRSELKRGAQTSPGHPWQSHDCFKVSHYAERDPLTLQEARKQWRALVNHTS